MRRDRVDVVVCIHNALDDVKACLASVVAQASIPVTLYLVNDGSDAPTTEWLRQFSAQYPFCQLLESPVAEGYTRAANRGLRAATAEYVVMLNSDTIVPTFWLERLLECGNSDPRIGIVGPLSNAASWQSIPECLSPAGDWATNPLPPGMTVEDMALLVQARSPRCFPRVPVVNGFCFVIKRAVIDAIGLFDEERFPKGYGEENDYCLRAADAGFHLAIADNAYVYHAKSKSYGHQARETLAKQGSAALREKYGQPRITALVQEIRSNPLLAEFRQTMSDSLVKKLDAPHDAPLPFSLLFLLPVRGGGGGAHSVVQEAQGMRNLGVHVQIANNRSYQSEFTGQYPKLNDTDDLFYFYDTVEELVAYASRFQVVIATIYHSVSLVQKIVKATPAVMPAYYVQDYEPLFFDNASKKREEARKSYTLVPGTVLFAKTQWLCEMVATAHGVNVEKVKPSLDHEVYTPLRSPVSQRDSVRIVAMIRPATPRRGAARTMLLLKRLKMTQQEHVHIDIFGCESSDPNFQELQHDFEFQQHGVLTREGVADLLRHADIFIDLSDYQAFGRTGLEAMACGCAVVLPQAGGAHEYAVDRENALVVYTSSDERCYAAVVDLVRDADLRRQLANNALVTAKNYSIEKSALSEVVMLYDQWRARQEPTESAALVTPTSHVQVSSRLRILGLLPRLRSGEFPASSYIRVILPLQHPSLQEHLQFAAVTEAGALAADGDILVVQRTALTDVQAAHRLIVHCRQRNIRLVYEIDDNLFAMPGHHSEEEAYHRAMQPVITILPYVDLLVVVSEKLKEKAQAFNRNVCVLPNALDERLWRADTSRKPPGNGDATTRILYMGSRTHANDLLVIKEAILRLTNEYATKVTLDVVGGVTVGEEQPWFHVPSHPLEARVNYQTFVEWFRTAAPWRIGVIPLADTEFNRCKSYIKYLDYAALGLATVCSDLEPYQGVVRNGINGILVENSTEAWYHALKRLIEEPALRTTLGQVANEDFVQNHTLKTQARKWLDTYRQAFNSR
jgi:GT2 family glycosyltransferase/glycosyltransferase involved in cell wall biosynthesis